jgi:hypothetical protein
MFSILIAAAAVQTLGNDINATPRHIDSDGVRATYTRSVDEDGTVHLRGQYEDRERTRFHYKVKGRKVDATIGGVRYYMDAPQPR